MIAPVGMPQADRSVVMAATPVDVVGSTPIAFTGSQGQQRSVPLSALQFNGSTLELKASWSAAFDSSETEILTALATAHAAAGRLRPPALPPPSAAVLVSSTVPGPESNNIAVTVTPDAGTGLATKMKFDVTATDKYADLTSAKSAATTIGVDSPGGDLAAGTGVVVVKMTEAAFDDAKLPVAQSGAVTSKGTDVKDKDKKVLFTLLPRSGAPSGDVTLDESGTSFTLTATYDSKTASGTQEKVAVTGLDALPAQVAFLVTASAPPSGVLLPAAATVQLTGGGPGLAANAVLYT
jgi:hypothetical protein